VRLFCCPENKKTSPEKAFTGDAFSLNGESARGVPSSALSLIGRFLTAHFRDLAARFHGRQAQRQRNFNAVAVLGLVA
jgi:hypothetical protein